MNLELDELTAKQLADICLVANTPGFLLKHFRRHLFVQELAREHTSAELLQAAAKLQSQEQFSDKDLLLVYALIAALSLKTDRDVKTALYCLRELSVRWARILVELAEGDIQRDSVVHVDLGFRVKTGDHSFDVQTNASTSDVLLSRKAAVKFVP